MATTPNRLYPLVNNGSATGGVSLTADIAVLLAAFGMIDADMQSVIGLISGKAGLSSPAFSGSPTAPTQATGDDSNKLATTAFVKAATALAIANLVNGAPSTLDALNELAAALGNDPNFATTVATQIGLKANSADVYLKTAVDALLAQKQDIASRGILSGLRNKLLNGSGSLIQRGSATIAAGASAYVFDRWLVTNNTDRSVVVSQNQLSLGSGFGPGGERFTMRFAFSTAPTTGNLRIEQRIEAVGSIKAGNWTLTSWMSGPSGTEALAAEIVQNFGTGGSPSSPVSTGMTFAGSSPTTIYNASTNWRCWGVTVPSLSGKLLGTAGNDYLAVAMQLFPRQAGNYDVTWSSFVEGNASSETDPQSPIGPALTLALCQRYYEKSYDVGVTPGTATYAGSDAAIGVASSIYIQCRFKVSKRATPTCTVYSPYNGVSGNIIDGTLVNRAAAAGNPGNSGFLISAAVSNGVGASAQWTAEAEL